jgi:ABC-2 type transport system permease protein
MLYHILTVHGLWYAPIYGWLLLVSAWAPRAPFLWAFLPPFVMCGVEKLAFNTTHCLNLLESRLSGPSSRSVAAGGGHMDSLAELIPQHFFSEPGLWIGLAIAAAFVFAAVRVRRYHGPI